MEQGSANPSPDLKNLSPRQIGEFVLHPQRGALYGPDGTEIALRPKTYALFVLLSDNAGQLIERERILNAVWPGLNVSDDSITQCIGEIRRALGKAGPELLRTVPKRGYILDAPARRIPMAVATEPAAPTPPGPPSRLPAILSVLMGAVLAAVLAYTVPQLLGRVPEPGMAAIGTARERAQPLYDQGRAIAYRSSGARGENWLKARDLFTRAVDTDPGFAAAYVEAVFTHTNMVTNGLSREPAADLRQAEALADRAAALAPDLPVVHAARAAVLRLQRRPAEALESYRRAVALDETQHASRANIGLMLILTGHPEEAEAPILRSLALAEADHPFKGTWLTYLGIADLQIGDGRGRDWGVERFRQSLDRQAFLPADIRRLYLAAALAMQGETEQARQLVKDVLARQPDLSASRLRQRELSDDPAYLSRQANLYHGLRIAGLPE
jgi:DNA-binding winged helix-turn-helix (wHTH) protein/Tfp pilus assembly protein PilF